MRRAWLLLMYLLATPVSDAVLLEKQKPEVTSIVSSSRHFVVRGMDPEVNLRLSIWCDEVARELTELLGAEVPFLDQRPVYLLLRDDDALDEAVVNRRSKFASGLLTQELRITNFNVADQEDMLENLVALLVERYVIARQDNNELNRAIPLVPAWFSVGVAPVLYSALRDRNRKVCVRQWMEKRLRPVVDVLAMQTSASGRSTLKCTCNLFYGWMQSLSVTVPVNSQFFNAWAGGEVIDLPWIMDHMPGLVSEKNIAKEWNLWAANRKEIRSEWSGGAYETIAVLKRKLNVRPKLMNAGYPLDGPDIVTPRQLLDLYDQPWFSFVVGKSSFDIAFQGLGQSSDMRDIIQQYQTFFETLKSLSVLHAKNKRTTTFRRARSKAERQLNEANLALAVYENRMQKVKQYVDAVENSAKARRSRTPKQMFVDDAVLKIEEK